MTKKKENYTFFWNGPFSNWHISPMDVRGGIFNCCEQYYMACKAATFGDQETLSHIMKARDPRTQKALGRKVKLFVPEVWDVVSKDVMFRANFAKYTQNSELRKALLETGDTVIAEASPYDRLWGIGMAENDPAVLDEAQWGKNWLGQILMDVRKGLQDTVAGIVFDMGEVK